MPIAAIEGMAPPLHETKPHPGRARRLWLPLLLSLSALACHHHLRIPPPVIPPGGGPPPLPESAIVLPVTFSLTELPGLMESQHCPFEDARRSWDFVEPNIGIKYWWMREPFDVEFRGEKLHIQTRARYDAAGCVKLNNWCPQVGSCGVGEPKRHLTIALDTSLAWSPDWHLSPATTARVTGDDECNVTLADYDARRFVVDAVSKALGRATKAIDDRLAEATRLEPIVKQGWDRLDEPIQLDQEAKVWLSIRPQRAIVSPLAGDELELSTTITLIALPVITFGPKPSFESTPLPRLSVGQAPEGFHVVVEGQVPLTEANALLSEQIAGKTYSREGRSATVNRISVEGVNGNPLVRVNVTADLVCLSDVTTELLLTGRVVYDPETETVSLQDVDYTPESGRVLLNTADFFFHEQLRREIAAAATFPLHDPLAALTGKVEAALDREIAAGVTLSGKLDTLSPLVGLVLEDRLVVRAEVTGKASLAADMSKMPAFVGPPRVACDMPDACQTCWLDVWDGPGFRGATDRLCGPLGEADMNDLPNADRGDWGDAIRSLKTGPKTYLVAWEDDDFHDTQIRVGPNESLESLRGVVNLDENIDSIKVGCGEWPIPLPPAGDCGDCWVEVFEHDGYGGAHDKICGPLDANSMRNLPGASRANWGDQIGSIKVGSKATVMIWEDENYEDN